MTEPTEQGPYTAGPIRDPEFYRVPCEPVPTCPTCGSDDPKVRGWKPTVLNVGPVGDWILDPLQERGPFPIINCPDSFHSTPTPVSDDGDAILDELASHADEDRQSEAYKEQKALCEAASDSAVREALAARDEITSRLPKRGSSSTDAEWVDFWRVWELVDALATLEAAIHQRDEWIEQLEQEAAGGVGMIQTFMENENRVVQAMRLTGTYASAVKVCRWLGLSKWRVRLKHGGSTYGLTIPVDDHQREDMTADKGQWVVLDSTRHVTVVSDAAFRAIHTRV